jgi:hypothetical protein
MYKLIKNFDNQTIGVQHQVDNVLYSIPFAPDNTDYQAYLAWVALGNVAEPAEEV